MADRRTDESPLAPRRSLGGSRDGQTRTSDEKQSQTGSEQQKRPAGSNGQNGSGGPQQNQSGNSQQSRPGNASQPGSGNTSQSGPGNASQPGSGNPQQNRPGNAQPGSAGPQQSRPGNAQPASGNPQQNRSGGSQQSSQSGEQRQGGGTTTDTRKPMADRVNEKVSGAVSAASETVRKVKDSWPEDRKTSAPSTKGTSATAGRPAGAPATSTARPRTRKARLRMTHVDPWSVMKIAFLLSIALGIVTVIAVAMVWSVLGAAGVWDSINQTVQEVIGGEDGTAFDVENYVGASRVLGFTMIVAVVDVVLITAIATLGAFLYNLAATLLGGLEVTLSEEEH